MPFLLPMAQSSSSEDSQDHSMTLAPRFHMLSDGAFPSGDFHPNETDGPWDRFHTE